MPKQPERMNKRQIYMAAASGKWREVSSYVKADPYWLRIPLTTREMTALHVAVSMEQLSFVEKLVECMNIQDLEICMVDGNTAFCLAAISGNVKIAQIMFDKNPRLVWIRGHKHMLPIQLASSSGHLPMTHFLFQNTWEDLHHLPFQDIVTLFFSTITNNIYPVALTLLDDYPALVNTENEEGMRVLQVLAQCSSWEESTGYRDILRLLFKRMEEEVSFNSVKSSKAMFDAAKSGNMMILEFLFKHNPDLLFEVNSIGQSLLHIAILHRQETVYQLILSKGASKNVIIQLVDFDGNNILHLAGKLAPEGRYGSSTNHVLMGSEELWFQEVEKIVPHAFKTMRNKSGWTPKELFYLEHKVLSEDATSGLKRIAKTFLVVGTLVITLGITGALAIPVSPQGIHNGPTLLFQKKSWYIISFLSTSVGVCLCTVSMIYYASVILPSSLKPKHEYVGSRQRKLILGNLALLASLGVTSISVASGSILTFNFLPSWIFFIMVALGCVPLVLNPAIDYKLWIQYVHLISSMAFGSNTSKIVPFLDMANFYDL